MSDLPKVVWTSPCGNVRAVIVRAVRDPKGVFFPIVAVEFLEPDAMGVPTWGIDVTADASETIEAMEEIIADLSGVKWRVDPKDLSP